MSWLCSVWLLPAHDGAQQRGVALGGDRLHADDPVDRRDLLGVRRDVGLGGAPDQQLGGRGLGAEVGGSLSAATWAGASGGSTR